MGYFKRLAVGWLGGFTVLMLYTLAPQSWSVVTGDIFALLLLTSTGCALIAAALSAAVIRVNRTGQTSDALALAKRSNVSNANPSARKLIPEATRAMEAEQ
jgi:hypothetical protein